MASSELQEEGVKPRLFLHRLRRGFPQTVMTGAGIASPRLHRRWITFGWGKKTRPPGMLSLSQSVGSLNAAGDPNCSSHSGFTAGGAWQNDSACRMNFARGGGHGRERRRRQGV